MGFQGRTYAEIYATPHDTGVNERILSLFSRSRGPCVFSQYGAGAPWLLEGFSSLLDRNIPLYGLLDHTQWSGPTERKAFAPFIKKYESNWRAQTMAVGCSPLHGRIAHAKRICFNAQIDTYHVPDGDFDSLDEAMEAGYPVSVFGSLNSTANADEQINDLCIIPSKIVSAMFVTMTMSDLRWNIEHHQDWQPFPVVAPGQ